MINVPKLAACQLHDLRSLIHSELFTALLLVGRDKPETSSYQEADSANACAGCPLHRCQWHCLKPLATILHYDHLQMAASLIVMLHSKTGGHASTCNNTLYGYPLTCAIVATTSNVLQGSKHTCRVASPSKMAVKSLFAATPPNTFASS